MKTEDELWEINVESDVSARDGRYDGSNKIYWETIKDTQGLADFVVEQRIIYDIESMPPGWKEEVVNPPTAEYTEAWCVFRSNRPLVRGETGHVFGEIGHPGSGAGLS